MDPYQISSEEWRALIDRIIASNSAGPEWTKILVRLQALFEAQRAYEQGMTAPIHPDFTPPLPTTLPDGMRTFQLVMISNFLAHADGLDPALASFRRKLSQYQLASGEHSLAT
jgi:hypothetical protein